MATGPRRRSTGGSAPATAAAGSPAAAGGCRAAASSTTTQPLPAGSDQRRANLAGYCTGHHRGKHQAPGWHHDLAPDGTLTVTTPTGLTAVTTPPPLLTAVPTTG